MHLRPEECRDTASVKCLRKGGAGGFAELGKSKWYMWYEQKQGQGCRRRQERWANPYCAAKDLRLYLRAMRSFQRVLVGEGAVDGEEPANTGLAGGQLDSASA